MSDNVGEPGKHDAKWKKTITKDPVLYDSICVKCPSVADLKTRK